MTHIRLRLWLAAALLLTMTLPRALAQTCSSPAEMDQTTRTGIENAVRQFSQMASSGNAATLQQSAIPSFTGLGNLVAENKVAFAGSPAIRAVYLLDNTNSKGGRTEFFCGIFNSPDRVGFVFGNLPPATYAVAVVDESGAKPPYMVTWVLQQMGGQWRVAGLFPRPTEIAGHNADWYLNQARAYKQSERHNAWFYYLLADQLTRPFPAMSTPQLDKLYDETQGVLPTDLPVNSTVELAANVCPIGSTTGCTMQTFKLTSIDAIPVGNELDLLVRFQVPDVSDSTRAFQQNTAVIKALVNKFPEFRKAFAGVVARATTPQGQDYGTLLPMKDIK